MPACLRNCLSREPKAGVVVKGIGANLTFNFIWQLYLAAKYSSAINPTLFLVNDQLARFVDFCGLFVDKSVALCRPIL